jgi:hypothetical protein
MMRWKADWQWAQPALLGGAGAAGVMVATGAGLAGVATGLGLGLWGLVASLQARRARQAADTWTASRS